MSNSFNLVIKENNLLLLLDEIKNKEMVERQFVIDDFDNKKDKEDNENNRDNNKYDNRDENGDDNRDNKRDNHRDNHRGNHRGNHRDNNKSHNKGNKDHNKGQRDVNDFVFWRKYGKMTMDEKLNHFHECIKSGWITFRTMKAKLLKKKKKKKWCVFDLVDNILTMYSNSNELQVKGYVFLDGMISVKDHYQNDEKFILLETKEKSYLMSTETNEELDNWLGIFEFAHVFLDSASLKEYTKANNCTVAK